MAALRCVQAMTSLVESASALSPVWSPTRPQVNSGAVYRDAQDRSDIPSDFFVDATEGPAPRTTH